MNPNPLAILRDIEQPPGGWRYTVPETGLNLTGASPATLRGKIASHLAANGLPVPDNDTLDSLICSGMSLGEPFCGPPFPTEKPKGVHPGLGIELANRFMKTMLQVVKDRKFVAPLEAQRRMDICNKCPLACGLANCWGCNGLWSTLTRLMPKWAPKSGKDKEWCAACGCRNEIKVLIDSETLDKAEQGSPVEYAPGCWRNEA